MPIPTLRCTSTRSHVHQARAEAQAPTPRSPHHNLERRPRSEAVAAHASACTWRSLTAQGVAVPHHRRVSVACLHCADAGWAAVPHLNRSAVRPRSDCCTLMRTHHARFDARSQCGVGVDVPSQHGAHRSGMHRCSVSPPTPNSRQASTVATAVAQLAPTFITKPHIRLSPTLPPSVGIAWLTTL